VTDSDGLGPRGRALWDDTEKRVAGERGRVLLLEACRIADRLDQLGRLLAGDVDAWAYVESGRADQVLELRLDAAMAEARQQAGTLRAILTTLPMGDAGDGDAAGAWLDGM
jgi:hypothetical protein